MSRQKKFLLFSMILLLAAYPAARYTWRGYVALDAYLSENNLDHAYRKLAQTCLEKFPAQDATGKIKNLRHCAFVHSRFGADKANEVYWKDWQGVLEWAQDHADGKRSDKPPMECFYRERTIRNMLKNENIPARQIVLTLNEDGFDGHVVIEIFNPDRDKWEMHDPLYDVDYRSAKDGSSLNLQQMLSLPIGDIVPCDFTGVCAWNRLNAEGMSYTVLKRYWNAAWVEEEGKLYVSPARFDVNKKRPVEGSIKSFCEHRPLWCQNIISLRP